MAKKITVGVLGCGKIAEEVHIPNLFNIAEYELRSLCDVSAGRLSAVGEKFGIPPERRFTSQEDFFRSGVEAVLVLSPTAYHYENTKAALEAGLHVFVEKPLCLEPAEGKELVEEAAKRNLVLSVGHFYGFFPQHILSKKKMKKLGRIKAARLVGESLIIKKEDGALLDYASHFIHLLLWYFDYPKVEWIFADLVPPKEGGKEMDLFLLAELAGGVRAEISILWLPGLKNWDVLQRHVEIIGEKGRLRAAFTAPEVTLYHAGNLISRARGMHSITPAFALHPSVPVSQTSYRKELEDFRDALSGEGPPAVDGKKSLEVMVFMEAARRSAASGKKVSPAEVTP